MSRFVIKNLNLTRNRLLNEINILSFDELNKKPEDNSWSIAQVCHHLFLVERVFTKAIDYGLKQINSKKAETKPIHLVSDRTMKAEAPEMVRPSGDLLVVEQIVGMLSDSRSRLLDVLSRVEEWSILGEKSAIHPLFGDLPLNQWIDLVYLHEDRHIKQIKEIKLLNQ